MSGDIFILFYFILFYFILFYFIVFYFSYFILFFLKFFLETFLVVMPEGRATGIWWVEAKGAARHPTFPIPETI